MKIRSKHIWLSSAIVAAMVLGIALYLWHGSGNQNKQVAPASNEVSQGHPGSTPNMFANGHSTSSEPAVTPDLTENSGKQPIPVEAWKQLLQEKPERDSILRFLDS